MRIITLAVTRVLKSVEALRYHRNNYRFRRDVRDVYLSGEYGAHVRRSS